MKSVIQKNKECYVCGNTIGLECHHIFGGTANRKLSEKYGLKVWLCHEHHTGNTGVHFDKGFMKAMHIIGQTIFERDHTRYEFMQIFGKNYLEEENEDNQN